MTTSSNESINKMSLEKYKAVQNEVESYGFQVVDKDLNRPWGAFLVIDEN